MLLLCKMRVIFVKLEILLQNKDMEYKSDSKKEVVLILFDLFEAII